MQSNQLMRCGRCGRVIKNPLAKEIGYGIVCAKKLGYVRVNTEIGRKGPRVWVAPKIESQQLVDLLGLVDVLVTVPIVDAWTRQDRVLASTWACLVHLKASDNGNYVPPRPQFLEDAPTVSAEMLKNGSIM